MRLAKNVLLSRQSGGDGTAGEAELLLLWAGSQSNVNVTLQARMEKTLIIATTYFKHLEFYHRYDKLIFS